MGHEGLTGGGVAAQRRVVAATALPRGTANYDVAGQQLCDTNVAAMPRLRAAHHAMLAGDRVLILTLGGLASARNILHAHACSSPSTTEIQSPYPSSAMRERGTKRRAAEFMQ